MLVFMMKEIKIPGRNTMNEMSLFLHMGKNSLQGIWVCEKLNVLAVGGESRRQSTLLLSLTFPREQVGYVLWIWPAKLSTL